MNNENVTPLMEGELASINGGLNSSDAIGIGTLAVGVSLGILCAPVGAGLLLCCLAGGIGLGGDAFIAYGAAVSQ